MTQAYTRKAAVGLGYRNATEEVILSELVRKKNLRSEDKPYM